MTVQTESMAIVRRPSQRALATRSFTAASRLTGEACRAAIREHFERFVSPSKRSCATAPSPLVRAGHIRAHHQGAAALADALFRTERAPHCLHWF